jgi:hypothetical protein
MPRLTVFSLIDCQCCLLLTQGLHVVSCYDTQRSIARRSGMFKVPGLVIPPASTEEPSDSDRGRLSPVTTDLRTNQLFFLVLHGRGRRF